LRSIGVSLSEDMEIRAAMKFCNNQR